MSGRVAYYGGIVKDGLVLNLDAGKKDSYNRVGTAWNDISGNAYNGTLTNGPTFNINNGGYFQFDGTNDYTTLGNISNLGFTGLNFTIEVWVYVPSTWTSGSQFPNLVSKGGSAGWDTDGWALWLFRNYPNDKYTWGFGMRNNGVTVTPSANYLNTYLDKFTHLMVSVSTTYCDFYCNGVFQVRRNHYNPIMPAPNSTDVLVGADAGVSRQFFPGRISIVRLYDRVLSASEVLQNYNATKVRYNL